ncbi:heparinase II/III family protein [Kribbella sp. VKM Ac-2566]|uniref:heparinase II/III domain-containing protein n=1 Tax=Kribbella sp. VKM Ac-2566 TaxID=2512218 RepID=UPI0010E4170B|nr:heparinase II/III family protein [Kribbella sp. VKM Ac-2566]TDW81335.1 heparinase II/III-like protein [Kribbella sp. VKM Ac-2566]
MPARHLRTSGTTLRLTIALLASVAVLGAVLMIPWGGSEPEAAPDPTVSHTPEPPTAPPAPVRQNVYTCPAYSGIDHTNPVANLYKDTFTWGTTPPTKVGDGKGNINWRMNPPNNPSWYMWLHSLRWLGQGIDAAAAGDKAALQRVSAITHDWVKDNPYSWKSDVGAYESTMHRTNVLICLRQAVLSGLHVARLPLTYAWLDKALLEHAWFLQKNYSGDWNHGTDESLALFGIGCTLQRDDLKKIASDRLTSAIKTSIDTQGSTNEQSTAYAQFNYVLWGRAIDVLRKCGADPGTTITARRRELAKWLALATNSLGNLPQLGDSEVVRTTPVTGTVLEYAGTRGVRGIRPTQRIGIFDAGYIFGRTGWGETRPFTQESTYSIRFGPSQKLHGHNDHTSITYTSRGRDILVDGGHAGYKMDDWRFWARSQFAHNEMTVKSATGHPETKLVRSSIQATSEFYELHDSPGAGIDRTRDVLVLKDPDLMVVLDRGSSAAEQEYSTLWHLPADQKVVVSGKDRAVAARPGDKVKTTLLQIPFQQQTTPIEVTTGQQDPIQGWHYRTIDKRLPSPVVKFNRSGRNASILSVIAPTRTNATVSYTTSLQGSRMIVNLTVDGVTTVIGVAADGTMQRIK